MYHFVPLQAVMYEVGRSLLSGQARRSPTVLCARRFLLLRDGGTGKERGRFLRLSLLYGKRQLPKAW